MQKRDDEYAPNCQGDFMRKSDTLGGGVCPNVVIIKKLFTIQRPLMPCACRTVSCIVHCA